MANKQTKVEFQKPVDGNRKRVAAHITETPSSAFGIEVSVNRHITPRQEGTYPSGHGVTTDEGQRSAYPGGDGPLQPGNQNYREVIPPGRIGTQEKYDMQLPAPQYVDTVAYMRNEDKCPELHSAVNALKSADRKAFPFQQYKDFQPRSAPMPRAAQDDVGFGVGNRNENTSIRLAADPLMTDNDSFTLFGEREAFRKDLYGDNVAGVLHNSDMQAVRIGQLAANGAPQTTKGGRRVGKNTSPATTETTLPPASQQPSLSNVVKLNDPTKVLPARSMKVPGATRAKR